jgi:hypothetical protein
MSPLAVRDCTLRASDVIHVNSFFLRRVKQDLTPVRNSRIRRLTYCNSLKKQDPFSEHHIPKVNLDENQPKVNVELRGIWNLAFFFYSFIKGKYCKSTVKVLFPEEVLSERRWDADSTIFQHGAQLEQRGFLKRRRNQLQPNG